MKWQAQTQIGSLEQGVGLREELGHHGSPVGAPKARCRGREGRTQKLPDAALQFRGDEGGDHAVGRLGFSPQRAQMA